MGKIKDYSDNEMDIEQSDEGKNIYQEDALKKKKKIKKNRPPQLKDQKVSGNKADSSKDIIKKVSKMVNTKKKHQPLDQKQEIFKRVFKGLKGKDMSKREKIKSRVILKKQLSEALRGQDQNKNKLSLTTSAMDTQRSQCKTTKKVPMNEKKQVEKIRQMAGSSLSQLKSLMAHKMRN